MVLVGFGGGVRKVGVFWSDRSLVLVFRVVGFCSGGWIYCFGIEAAGSG